MNTRNYIGATSYEQALINARRDLAPYYNQINCYQAKADLAQVIDTVQKDKLNPNPTTIQRAWLVEMQNLVSYLTNWVAQHCQEANPTPPPVIVLPPTPTETPGDNYETPPPTDTGSNKMIWIAGVAVIGFIVWNNRKKKRKK